MKKYLLSLFLLYALAVAVFPQQLVLGNPSGPANRVTDQDNFLVVHGGYILSYNRSRGTPNWVSWHVSASDIGPVDRANNFRPDTALPVSWQIKKNDYTNSGYDRGHMCPSKDRSNTAENNSETFLMSNMQPQLHSLNGGVWKSLEGYVQNLVRQGLEAYIIAGCYGDNGTLNDKGKVKIPGHCWKIVLLLTDGRNDLRRINENTRVVAVDMPNNNSTGIGWKNFRTTVDDIEAKTALNFFSTLPGTIEQVLESRKDVD